MIQESYRPRQSKLEAGLNEAFTEPKIFTLLKLSKVGWIFLKKADAVICQFFCSHVIARKKAGEAVIPRGRSPTSSSLP